MGVVPEALLIPLGSLAAIGALVGLAALLRLPDQPDLTRAAIASGLVRFDPRAQLVDYFVTSDGRAAFGRAADGRVVIARAMGIHLAVRALPAERLKISAQAGADGTKLWHFGFGDAGFPDFTVPVPSVLPAWWPLESLETR